MPHFFFLTAEFLLFLSLLPASSNTHQILTSAGTGGAVVKWKQEVQSAINPPLVVVSAVKTLHVLAIHLLLLLHPLGFQMEPSSLCPTLVSLGCTPGCGARIYKHSIQSHTPG